ncbi:CAP domain-containing protein [Sulfitobacter sp. PS-8MA]|uniref:CAP domain-containing protein n=1 Tax=Sulfitobacter sp. PS-8MA TaxID=3237707 RepID=UPI0034C5EEC2
MKQVSGAILALAALPALADPMGVEAVNALRDVKGLEPLSYNSQLEQAAEAHARDMAQHGYFGHQGRDGATVGDRVTAAGYKWCFVAENVAKGQRSLEAVMTGWTNSPGHYRNMVETRAREMGLARAGDDVWVMVLAAPC